MQLLEAINDFHNCLDTGSHIDALFLDFTCYGINNNLLQWFNDYLTDRSQYVLIDGVSSKSHPVLSSVPQGSVLAPLLFLIYINDITDSIINTIRLYADNVLIYRVINSKADTTCLQNDLLTLEIGQKSGR